MNTIIKNQLKSVFAKVFDGLAEQLETHVSNVSIGVEYRNSSAIYYAYMHNKKIKHAIASPDVEDTDIIIDITDYVGLLDALNVSIAKMYIDNKGVSLANEEEINCACEELDVLIAPNILSTYKIKSDIIPFVLNANELFERKQSNGILAKDAIITAFRETRTVHEQGKAHRHIYLHIYEKGKPTGKYIEQQYAVKESHAPGGHGLPLALVRKSINGVMQKCRYIDIENEF